MPETRVERDLRSSEKSEILWGHETYQISHCVRNDKKFKLTALEVQE